MPPPVAPERFERVDTLEIILVTKLARGVAGVALDVDVCVAAFLERFQARDISLNDGGFDARDSELAEREPCPGFVDMAGDALAPVLLVEDQDTTGGLLDAGASVLDRVEARRSDELALRAVDDPDSPDHRIIVRTHAVVPFQLIFEHWR